MIDTTGGAANTQSPEETKRASIGQGGAQGASQGALADNPPITLQCKFISGLKSDVTDNIFFLDDNQVVYPAGHNIVVYHLEDAT